MAITQALERLLGPSDDEVVQIELTGQVARAFVAMLNMNKVRDAQGRLIVFAWEPSGESWALTETVWSDR